ncbi:MAG: lysophospholipid acyltransferase family protein [Bacteroidota bacterium]
MSIKKSIRSFLRWAGNYFLASALTILCSTLKITVYDSPEVNRMRKEGCNFIYAFWHGHMLIPWFFHRGQGIRALVSKSKDGELLCSVLSKWGYQPVRGSSSTGGSEALLRMVKMANDGYTLAITPDGPRGPEYVFKPGAVITAQRAQVPLVLLATGYEKTRVLRSWDHFRIPKFFSKVSLVFSDPIMISSNFSREQIAGVISDCQDKLNTMQEFANSKF